MADSTIAQYLNKILEAVYGKDVRQAIYDSISQCYKDVNSPILNITAMKAAIQEKIDDGTIPNMTLADGSVTEEKIEPNFLKYLTDQTYIMGDDGKKYTVGIDKDGNFIKKPFYEIPKEGLVIDLQVKGNQVIDTVSRKAMPDFEVSDDYFKPTKIFNLLSDKEIGSSFTIICVPFLNTSDLAGRYSEFFRPGTGYYPMYISYLNTTNTVNIYDVSGFTDPYFTKNFYNKCFLESDRNICLDNCDMFLAFSKDYENQVYTVTINDYTEKKTAGAKELTYLAVGTALKYKRVMIYNRPLSDDEVIAVYKSLEQKYYDDMLIPSKSLQNGLVGLGSPTAFGRKTPAPYCEYFDVNTSVGGHSYESQTGEIFEFENIAFENPTVESDTSKFEELIFINPIESIKIGEMYALEAMPYPYNVKTDSYNIEYQTNAPNILECYQGVLIPKSIGRATITAKISNSNITKEIEIEVKEKDSKKENLCYISENYCYGVHALNSKNPTSVANAIKGAILESKRAGYDGIVFPQKEYHVKFSDVDEDNVFIYIPSDFIVDFNNSTFYVVPRDDIKEKGIALFSFGNQAIHDAETGYNDWVICGNSEIRNLYFYGERYTTSYSNENEFKGSRFVDFRPGARNCKLYNVHTEGTTGWVINSYCSDYNYWTGTGRRGRTYYNDYVSGKLDETGTKVIEDSTGTWYCTPEYLELGYVYGKDSIKTNEMDKYVFGFMGIVTYGNSGRWYDIYFFDSEKNLISYNPKQFGLEPYQLPENAVYFKVNVPFGETPTKNSGEDQCVIRLYPYMEPTGIYIDKCSFVNPQYTCLSMTGGVGFVVRDTYVENGVITGWMWAIDWEDGWQAMRHNIHYKVLCSGNLEQPGGHHCCVLSSVISGEMRINNDTESTVTLNSAIKNLNVNAKTNEFVENVFYSSFSKSYSFANISTIRDVNNSKLDSWPFS